MSSRRTWIEGIKSVLILALTVSAVFLGWKTGLLQRMLPERIPILPDEPSPGTSTYLAAARPVCAAVTGAAGLIHGVCYNVDKMDELMQSFRPVLGETLGSASAPRQLEEDAWKQALKEPGLFLDYGVPVSLNVLAAWYGSSAAFADDQRADRLLFSLTEDEEVKLCYLDGQGSAWCCDTLALGSTLYEEINAYLPNGAEFAMEVGSLTDCDPYALILRELPKLSAVYAVDTGQDAALQKAAELCRMNLGIGSSFQEQDGTVFLGDMGRLRLETDGCLHYSASDRADWGTLSREADQLELSRSILVQLAAACGGVGELEYAGTEYGAETTQYRFAYRVMGMQVKLNAGTAAWAVFRDGKLEEFGFRPRTYFPTGTVDRIPPLQAAAVAGSIQKGSLPELVLPDPGGTLTIEPLWSLRERSA
jgi:hypothetical protein